MKFRVLKGISSRSIIASVPDPEMLLPGGGGGGALKAEVLNLAAKAGRFRREGGGEYERGFELTSH